MEVVETPVGQLVHPILTAEQALLVHQALVAFLNSPEESFSANPDEEQRVRSDLSELVFFFNAIVEHPEQFPLRSRDDNTRIVRARKAALKGPAQPQSRKNKRKARQARRMSHAKRRRANRGAEAADQRQALARVEQDMADAQEAYETAKQRFIDRFEGLARKDTLSNEELQEVLELFGSPEAAERVRELRAADQPQARLDRAAAAVGAGQSEA